MTDVRCTTQLTEIRTAFVWARRVRSYNNRRGLRDARYRIIQRTWFERARGRGPFLHVPRVMTRKCRRLMRSFSLPSFPPVLSEGWFHLRDVTRFP